MLFKLISDRKPITFFSFFIWFWGPYSTIFSPQNLCKYLNWSILFVACNFQIYKKSDFKTPRSGYGHEWISSNLAFTLLSQRSKNTNLQAVKCQSYCCHMLNEGIMYSVRGRWSVNCFTFQPVHQKPAGPWRWARPQATRPCIRPKPVKRSMAAWCPWKMTAPWQPGRSKTFKKPELRTFPIYLVKH